MSLRTRTHTDARPERVPFRRKALAWFIVLLMVVSALTAFALIFQQSS